ncbi:hypothetical protein SAMN02982929_01389 [Saccharopolyspora kobensis]|uniref:Uncharacterized protein n=1 Tax=Saccharopolyspora kobensis TaxID=146035 RepID=A0A1H5X395_9PSEU|nr:hypothetical protein [Saccharopolyspora kobensis]SEG06274.1 hypothetical protein SAMN02982929_01389 [Saccharopolyspora kobensis]SFD82215.1 hypothetical protein SAMN05216506_106366 [Saccharopolyspora kobensis]
MQLSHCTTEELDARARRAEHQLTLARQSRQWHLADRYRREMRAVAAEYDRRLGSGPHRTRAMLRAEVG